ncbi:hypothetical protein K461DRAFT_275160 [Myriangium duriaei CBS 260.36]|uniref:Uncharacterized protein n=1 Tax=Myriangium duriaei CBS 260.36 TaxID=1168546 RepID=A0A9P4JAE6_9PEZI|nr:hypothetical protein K461DRAFT_275160 [Myriangium duriaei CBS 260.36]
MLLPLLQGTATDTPEHRLTTLPTKIDPRLRRCKIALFFLSPPPPPSMVRPGRAQYSGPDLTRETAEVTAYGHTSRAKNQILANPSAHMTVCSGFRPLEEPTGQKRRIGAEQAARFLFPPLHQKARVASLRRAAATCIPSLTSKPCEAVPGTTTTTAFSLP